MEADQRKAGNTKGNVAATLVFKSIINRIRQKFVFPLVIIGRPPEQEHLSGRASRPETHQSGRSGGRTPHQDRTERRPSDNALSVRLTFPRSPS